MFTNIMIQERKSGKNTAIIISTCAGQVSYEFNLVEFYTIIDFHVMKYARSSTNTSLQWRHNGVDSVSNHQPRDCLFSGLFRCISKKISKLCVTGLCAGNSPGTGDFPAQMVSNAENVSISWRHHGNLPMPSPILSKLIWNVVWTLVLIDSSTTGIFQLINSLSSAIT